MPKKVVCFGEVLWDVLPGESIAGGAPMNVAIRLQSLGVPSLIISRTGRDEAGSRLLDIIRNKNVDCSLIQEDPDLPTGEVLVSLDGSGSATYDIVYPSAWDKIAINPENVLAVKNADAFVFGSLACRDLVSANTLVELLGLAIYKIFDVNLRSPFYSFPLIEKLMRIADLVKMNDDELALIASAMGSASADLEENIRFISHKTQTETVCVTRGANGAVLYIDGQLYSHPGFEVKVADTIGAGDSFLAALIAKNLGSTNYQESLNFAAAMGAIVASHKGANPEITMEEITQFLNQ